MLPTNDKERKALPVLTFLTKYFPDAILAMVRVSVAGNVQHNPELAPADIQWARGKSTDQLNTAFRHLWDHATGTKKDTDGQYHLAKCAWRVLAELQLTIEAEAGHIVATSCETNYAALHASNGAAAVEAGGHMPFGGVAPPLHGKAAVEAGGHMPFGGVAPPLHGKAAVDEAPLLRECQHGYTVCRVCQFP